jgi:hypothetical protein
MNNPTRIPVFAPRVSIGKPGHRRSRHAPTARHEHECPSSTTSWLPDWVTRKWRESTWPTRSTSPISSCLWALCGAGGTYLSQYRGPETKRHAPGVPFQGPHAFWFPPSTLSCASSSPTIHPGHDMGNAARPKSSPWTSYLRIVSILWLRSGCPRHRHIPPGNRQDAASPWPFPSWQLA